MPNLRILRILALLPLVTVLLALAAPAPAAPGDENWDSLFGLPGADGLVQASAVFNGDLVIGGEFVAIGSAGVKNLARWTGSQWVGMGSPFDGDVSALIVWNNELYAGGGFTGGLARWTGSQWVTVGGGVDGTVHGLAVFGTSLAVGGDFTSVDGGNVTAGGVALWNGSSWNDLNGGTTGTVNDVESFGGSLYVCGTFDICDGVLTPNIARWSGTAWSSVGGGLKDDTDDIYNAYGNALTVSGGRLIVAGYFAKAGTLAADGIVAWTGSAYTSLGTPSFGGEGHAVGTYGTNLVANDAFGNIKLWNGSFWNAIGLTTLGIVETFTEQGGALVVGGAFATVNGTLVANLASYNGSWSPLAAGQPALGTVEVFHEWNGSEVAGGRFSSAGSAPGVIGRWDGAAWQALGTGIPRGAGNYVEALATFGNDLIVGGFFPTAGGVSVNNIARWNGTTWSAMGSGSVGNGVSGMIVLDDTLYAGGRWGGQYTLGRWNGSDFVPLGTAIGGGVQLILGVGSYQGDPLLCGGFTTVNGVTVNNLGRWNGATWQSIGGGTDGAVYAAREIGGNLYVAGTFTHAGGVAANRVAMWDGVAWHALGAGVNNRTFELEAIGNDVYVTGDFTQAGGQPAAHVAMWDGGSWHALGSGVNGNGHALDVQNGKLWVGGEFNLAGLNGSYRVARWDAGTTTAVGDGRVASPPIALRLASRNPFTGTTTLAFELPAPAAVAVDVYDLSGARVRSLSRGVHSPGTHRVQWDGCDASGRAVPAGVYFVEFRAGDSSARQRVVRTR